MFNWIQNKLNGRRVSKKQDFISSANQYKQEEQRKEEFIDWHKGLLTIGTIGNEKLLSNLQQNPPSSEDLTLEEEGKLQNELNLLLHEHAGASSAAESEGDPHPSLDKILDHSSSGDEESANDDTYSDDSNRDSGGHVQRSTSVVCSKGKDICTDNTKRAIGKKSLSFLVKKVIACRGGFSPTRSIRDPVSESRMEKMLRAILHNKIYPQSPSTTLSTKKYLANRGRKPKSAKEDEINEKPESGSKWVKTDSEYIVLEI
ncbi:hypothetical protein Pint_13529 [Pistacia integerrima]|uniref:Uncharacterized protein n=1 Tax=Pistacia integerrima TaxID=434235 RepID=A0ACC0Y3X9_9ROSI|nr:hypothetical protein Pint_13529 [Pistacia integerrima]